jgi:hypothetical protein
MDGQNLRSDFSSRTLVNRPLLSAASRVFPGAIQPDLN